MLRLQKNAKRTIIQRDVCLISQTWGKQVLLGVPSADEHLAVVPLQHRALLHRDSRGECHTVHRLLMPAEDRSGSKCKRVTLLVGWNTMSNLLVSQTSSKYGRRCLFQRPTAAQWSQSWQRRAPEDQVVSIRSGTTEIIFRIWWSRKKSNPCSYQVHVWILCARACGAPFYGVDLLLMSLERVNGGNLIV